MIPSILILAACVMMQQPVPQQNGGYPTLNQNPNQQTAPSFLLGDYEFVGSDSVQLNSPSGNRYTTYFRPGDVFFADSADQQYVFGYLGSQRFRLNKTMIKPYDVPSAEPSPTMQTPLGSSETTDSQGGRYYVNKEGKRIYLRQYKPEVQKTSK